jgi:hypothetical protein
MILEIYQMSKKSFWISFSLVMLIILALFSLFIITEPRQIDLSYDSSPQKLIMYADSRWYPGIPSRNEPPCWGQTYPTLRVWGDGTVFYEYWVTGQPEPSYWTGDLTSDQIQSILNSLVSHGFFSGWTPEIMNPAGQFLKFGAHITQKDIEYTGQEVYPAFFNQIIDQIKPHLVLVDLKTITDVRVISLIDLFQSCFSPQENTPEPSKPTATPILPSST